MTPKEARSRTRWFQKVFLLQDWRISLFIREDPPDWVSPTTKAMAECVADAAYKRAKIWVSNSRCRAYNESVEESLFHEFAHVVCADVGILGECQPQKELVWNSIGETCEKAYRYDKKLRRKKK